MQREGGVGWRVKERKEKGEMRKGKRKGRGGRIELGEQKEEYVSRILMTATHCMCVCLCCLCVVNGNEAEQPVYSVQSMHCKC